MDQNEKNLNNLNKSGAERKDRRDDKTDQGYSNRTGDLDRVTNMDTDLDSGIDNSPDQNAGPRGDALDSDVDHEKLDQQAGPDIPGDSDLDLNYDRDPMRRNIMYGPDSRRGSHSDTDPSRETSS